MATSSSLPPYGLHWFRRALSERPAGEPVIESVNAAIFAFPYDVDAVMQIANLRVGTLDPGRIVQHMRRVQSDFAHALLDHLHRRHPDADELGVTVAARAIAAAVFAGSGQSGLSSLLTKQVLEARVSAWCR